MIVFWGAGKEFEKLIKSCGNKWKEEFLVVDTYPEKYPNGVLGYEVRHFDLIREMTSDDTVFITSNIYYDEIYDHIRRINQKVTIYNSNAAKWLMYKRVKIPGYIALEDKYEVHIDIKDWLEAALNDEIGYWERAIPECRTRNDGRFFEREFIYGYNKELVFTENDIILDVGCGPLPKFGNYINGRKIQYIPVDPLAHQYKSLLRKLGVILPVEPEFAIMEILTCFYEENTMDYVIVNNALDHCIDILRAFIECLQVVKVGGYFLMEHMEAEGLHNEYEGLHKWNITCTDTDLICFDGKGMKLNLSKIFQPYAEIEVKRIKQTYRDLIIAKIRKKDFLPQCILEEYDDKRLIGDLINKLFERLLIKINCEG